MFSHVNATFLGLTTIRSAGAQEMVRKQFDDHQDLHTGTYSLIVATGISFGFALDMVSIAFIAVVTYSFVALDDGNFLSLSIDISSVTQYFQIFLFSRKYFCRERRLSYLASAHFVRYAAIWNTSNGRNDDTDDERGENTAIHGA